ncbi:FAD-dependent pyridine nucleotide-disulfide oxidoreductase, partial [Acidiphilium sp. PM]
PPDHDQMKRLTRVSMGPCQARRCREQVALLMAIGAGLPAASIGLAGYRAPVRPLPLSALAAGGDDEAGWDVWFGILSQWVPYAAIGTEREDAWRAGSMHL